MLKLSPDAPPVQLAPRFLPQSNDMPQLNKQQDKMEQEGMIRVCPETTEWVHNLVTVAKKDGSLRICLGPRNLNKYLIRNEINARGGQETHTKKNVVPLQCHKTLQLLPVSSHMKLPLLPWLRSVHAG